MSKSDGGLRGLFRREMLATFDVQSIESGMTGGGIPDMNYAGGPEGVEGWIEFKWTKGWACTLEPEQVGWHERRWRHGGLTWIAVRRETDGGPRSPAADELWMVPGCWARLAKTGGLRTNAVPWDRWQGGPARWPWDIVLTLVGTPRAAMGMAVGRYGRAGR